MPKCLINVVTILILDMYIRIDNEPFILLFPGTSPLELTDLISGYSYVLRVIPIGVTCDPIKKMRKEFVYVEPYTG